MLPSSKVFLLMFSFNPLPYLLAAVVAPSMPSNLPVQPFDAALAPLLDIAACDGMVDRIQGFEPFSSGGQLFIAVQAAPGRAGDASNEYEAPVIGPLEGIPAAEHLQTFIGRPVCVAIYS